MTLYSAPTGGRLIGGPLTMNAVRVHEGSFSTNADFGQSIDVSASTYAVSMSRAVMDATSGSALTAVSYADAAKCPNSQEDASR